MRHSFADKRGRRSAVACRQTQLGRCTNRKRARVADSTQRSSDARDDSRLIPALIYADARIPWAVNTTDLPIWRRLHVQREMNVSTEAARKMRNARVNRDHATQRADQCSSLGPVRSFRLGGWPSQSGLQICGETSLGGSPKGRPAHREATARRTSPTRPIPISRDLSARMRHAERATPIDRHHNDAVLDRNPVR